MSRQTFEVLVLGSSSASPDTERGVSGQYLNICERHFLIDCGEGVQIQLRRYKARFQSINAIFISHLHGDHIFGLPGFLSSMHLLGRKNPLTIYGPPRLRESMLQLLSVSDTQLNYPLEWVETRNDGMHLLYEDEKTEVWSFPLDHRIFCTGFLFKEKPLPRKVIKEVLAELNISVADIMRLKAGEDVINEDGRLIKNAEATMDPAAARSYAYCCDTAFREETAHYVRGVNVLCHESTFLKDHEKRAASTRHSTAEQAATVAKMAGVGRLVLTHFSARYRYVNDFVREAAAIFPETEAAGDGKLFKI